jgi:peptidoglycan-associated lipoprotein
MKFIKRFNLMVLALAVILAGCATGVQKPTRIPGSRVNPDDENLQRGNRLLPQPEPTPRPDDIKFTPPNEIGHPGWPEDAESLKPQTIYFALDKSAIKPSEQSKLDAVASFLKSNPTKAVRVEGNCDERGTEEYNRSLGERRALAAREYLIQSGIDSGRVDTVTRGEDNPAVRAHNETAWSKNRRDEFIVLTPK